MTIPDDNYISDGYDVNDIRFSSTQGITTTNHPQTYPGAFEGLEPTGWSAVDAVARAVRFLSYRTNDPNITDKPSRCFLYCNARDVLRIKDRDEDWKEWPTDLNKSLVQLRTVFKALNTFGVVPEDQCPWRSPSEKPYPRRLEYVNAAKTPLFNIFRLDYDMAEGVTEPDVQRAIGTQNLYRVRQCLSQGSLVMFAFHFHWPTLQTIAPASKDGGFPTIEKIHPSRRGVGPHGQKRSRVVLAIDNDQINRRLLIKSNWGDSVPYFWMPYEWVLDFGATEGFWTISPSQSPAPRLKMWYRDGDFVHPWHNSNLAFQSLCPSYGFGNFKHSNIAVLPRGDYAVDIFWVDPEGRIIVGHYNKSRKDPGWRFAYVSGPGTATGSVAVVRPWPVDHADRMEVFSIGSQGHVILSRARVGDEEDPSRWWWDHDRITGENAAKPKGCIVVTQPPVWAQWKCRVFWVQVDGCIGTAQEPMDVDGDRKWRLYTLGATTNNSPFSRASPLSSLTAISIPWEDNNYYWSALWWIDLEGCLRGLWVSSECEYQDTKLDSPPRSFTWREHIRMDPVVVVPKKSRLSSAQSFQHHYVALYYQNSSGESHTKCNGTRTGDPMRDDRFSRGLLIDESSQVKAVNCEHLWKAFFITKKPDRTIVYRDGDGWTKNISQPGCLPDSAIMEYTESHMFVRMEDDLLGIADL
jgi:hypothetical protein